MRKFVFLLLAVIAISSVYAASCGTGKVDINSASEEALTEIVHIGPARAEQIVNLRPFESVDDLIRVSGIGEIYLENIKSQDVACVGSVEKGESVKKVLEEEEKPNIIEELKENETEENKPKVIELNPEIIKTDEAKNVEVNYAVIGFVAFSIFIIILFLWKTRHKSEFE